MLFSYSRQCVFLCGVTDVTRSAFKAGCGDALNVKTLDQGVIRIDPAKQFVQLPEFSSKISQMIRQLPVESYVISGTGH